MIPKPLDHVTEEDLQALIEDERSEDRRIEYKRQIAPDEAGKRTVRKAACAFANTQGGDLIIGIEESAGKPTSLAGVSAANADDESGRLQGIIQRALEPRLSPSSFAVRNIDLANGRVAFVIRVERSWRAPHRVEKDRNFYIRGSVSTEPLGVDQIRAEFLQSEGQAERIRTFVADRVAAISAGDISPLPPGSDEIPRLVMQIIPIGSLDPGSGQFSPAELRHLELLPMLSQHMGIDHRQQATLEGLSVFCPTNEYESMVTMHWSGLIEAIDCYLLSPAATGEGIPSLAVQGAIYKSLVLYLRALASTAVRAPGYLFIHLIGVRDRLLLTRPGLRERTSAGRLRELVSLPSELIEDWNRSAFDCLRRPFDRLWQAAGQDASPYSEETLAES